MEPLAILFYGVYSTEPDELFCRDDIEGGQEILNRHGISQGWQGSEGCKSYYLYADSVQAGWEDFLKIEPDRLTGPWGAEERLAACVAELETFLRDAVGGADGMLEAFSNVSAPGWYMTAALW